ncbi:hypothetical protein Tco_0956951, partial [Tanacetum coccineum]
AMMDADCELAAKLQEEERGELSIEEKSNLFVELMNKRKTHFAKLRAEKIKTMDSGAVKDRAVESSKRAGEELEFDKCLEVVPDDGDDVTPLSSKPPTIIDYKNYIEGKKTYFQIIRADVSAAVVTTVFNKVNVVSSRVKTVDRVTTARRIKTKIA